MLAGLALLVAHALFKAALFMVVGIIDHSTGTRDIRRLAWLGHESRPLFVIAALAAASMAAVPPFLGFVAKEADFETLAHSASLGAAAPFVLAGVVLASVFTTIYSLRFLWGAFARKGRASAELAGRAHAPTVGEFPCGPGDSGRGQSCARASCRAGSTTLLDDYADTLPGGRTYQLELWHGLGSAAGPVGGRARRRRRRLRCCDIGCAATGSAGYRSATPTAVYDAVVRGCRHAVAEGHGRHPARLDPGDPGGDPVHAGAAAGRGTARRGEGPPAVPAVGLRAASRWSAC